MPSPARIALAVLLAVSASQALAQQTLRVVATNERPPLKVVAPAQAKMLHAASYAEAVRALGQVRQIPVASLRSRRPVTVGRLEVNFQPLLDNPRSLPAVAQQLRTMPQLVSVAEESLEAVEVRNGLVVRSALTYRLGGEACKPSNRSRIEAVGLQCFTAISDAQFQQATGRSTDPRHVAEAASRSAVLNARRVRRDSLMADIAPDLATLRARAQQAQQRDGMASALGGEAELARLLSLDDANLMGELVNRGQTTIEQIMFVPLKQSLYLPKLAPAPAAAPRKDVDNRYPLERQVFLAGFTLGDEYEWSQQISTTIDWCVFWCPKTYYVKAYASFSFGLGMRFPVAVDGEYRYRLNAGGESAVVVPEFTPFDGSAQDYRAAGLDSQIFAGKEVVAEIKAGAGLAASFPGIGGFDASFQVGKDFTEDLPGDFKGGNFTPPAPGQPGPGFVKVFDNLDLIGGRGNLGLVGAQLFPAIRTELVSNALSFVVEDGISGKSVRVQGGKEVPLAMDKDKASLFRIRDPEYSLQLALTPGLNARMFVDLAFWGSVWDWQVWFPQLGLTIPEGGVKFACHAGSTCVREYRFVPEGAQSVLEKELLVFADQYDARWMPQCPAADALCRSGLRFFRNFAIGSARSQKAMSQDLRQAADGGAQAILNEARLRADSEAWVVQMETNWGNQCLDTTCAATVSSLAKDARVRATQLVKPGFVASEAIAQVKAEFQPRFLGAVQASRARVQPAMDGTLRRATLETVPALPKTVGGQLSRP
jgi:hypothetical protein